MASMTGAIFMKLGLAPATFRMFIAKSPYLPVAEMYKTGGNMCKSLEFGRRFSGLGHLPRAAIPR
jgi:hypothetical protein